MFELKHCKIYRICGGDGNVTCCTTGVHNCNWRKIIGYPYPGLPRFLSVSPENILYINCFFLIATNYIQLIIKLIQVLIV